MLLKRQPIESTDLAEYFEPEASDRGLPLSLQVLDRPSAELVWARRFGSPSRSYYSLPDDSPIVKATWESIGDWKSFYNNDDVAALQPVLAAAIPWPPDSPVLFCVNNALALSCTWAFFMQMWDCFLALEDDSPFVIAENEQDQELLWFTPLGDVRKLKAAHSSRRATWTNSGPTSSTK